MESAESNIRMPGMLVPSFQKLVSTPEGKDAMKRIRVECGVCLVTRFYSIHRGITRISGIVACEACRQFYQRFNKQPFAVNCSKGGRCFALGEFHKSKCKGCWVAEILLRCPLSEGLYNKFIPCLPDELKERMIGHPPLPGDIAVKDRGDLGLEIYQNNDWVDVTDKSEGAKDSNYADDGFEPDLGMEFEAEEMVDDHLGREPEGGNSPPDSVLSTEPANGDQIFENSQPEDGNSLPDSAFSMEPANGDQIFGNPEGGNSPPDSDRSMEPANGDQIFENSLDNAGPSDEASTSASGTGTRSKQRRAKRFEASETFDPDERDGSTKGSPAVMASLLEGLHVNNQFKFMENFNPKNSERVRRKKKKVQYFSSTGRGKRDTQAVHLGDGRLAGSGRNLCDCLQADCPGCHFPCPKCGSGKCGLECRMNRKWYYESVEVEGTKLRWHNEFMKK